MDFEKIITYLDISCEDEEKVKSFFEQEDLKIFLSERWADYNRNLSSPLAMPQINPQKEKIHLEQVDEDADNTYVNSNENAIPVIPNMLDDEEAEVTKDAKLVEAKDEVLDIKLKNKFIQLQNGKVNQPYQCLFDITTLEIADIGDFWFEGLDAIGLSFNKSTDLIEGTPTKAGDHKIVLKCKRTAWQAGDHIFERFITLIINPDPRSLWNNIATPKDIDYYRPDSDSDYIKVESSSGFLGFGKKEKKDIVAASVRGRSHAHEGSPRDDDFSIQYVHEGNWYVMVVADGAGSAQYSRQGSHIACTTVSDVCKTQFTKYSDEVENFVKDYRIDCSESKRKKLGDALYCIIGSAVFKAYKSIEKEAQEKGVGIKDFSTTLLVTVSKRFKFGWFVASFWVGDGAIAIYDKKKQYLKILGESDGGEFAGQTRFMTMPEIMQPTEIYRRLRFEFVEDFTAIVLMTDGVTDPKFETDSNLQKIEKWNNLWDDLTASVQLTDDNEDAKNQLLKWLQFWSSGNHDDRTIAILY